MSLNTGSIIELDLTIPDLGQIEAVELCEKLGRGGFGHVWKARPIVRAEMEKIGSAGCGKKTAPPPMPKIITS